MYRHSPIRNPRSKGMKMKHVVQVLLLVGVCIWLIFQVKRSHDKRKEFDASDNKVLLNTHTHISDDVIKFGRKYLHPKVEETTKEIEIHQETQEQEDEEEHEEEGNDDKKHVEEEVDDVKIDEGEKDDGDDDDEEENDENEEERSDVEIDREEVNIIDEEEEEDKEEEETTEVNDGQNQSDNNEVSLADHDEEDGSAVHTNEAREENYNGDDASSAVTHNGRIAKNTTSSDTTAIQEKDYEFIVTSLNATTSIDSHDNGPPLSTILEFDSNEAPNATVSGEQAGNSSVTTSSYGGQVVSNATIDEITQGSSNSKTQGSTQDNTSDASKTQVGTDGGENLETNDVTDQVTDESLDSDEVERNPSHLDLDTLPEIETAGGNSEDSAAE